MLFRSDRKSTRLNSSHTLISYAVFCLKKNIFTDTMDGVVRQSFVLVMLGLGLRTARCSYPSACVSLLLRPVVPSFRLLRFFYRGAPPATPPPSAQPASSYP